MWIIFPRKHRTQVYSSKNRINVGDYTIIGAK